jgi:hypothetical protein
LKESAGENLQEDLESSNLILGGTALSARRYLHGVERGFLAAVVMQLEQQ